MNIYTEWHLYEIVYQLMFETDWIYNNSFVFIKKERKKESKFQYCNKFIWDNQPSENGNCPSIYNELKVKIKWWMNQFQWLFI